MYSLQHRQARGAGGSTVEETNLPANLVLVHGHALSECHAYIEAHPVEAAKRGFRIRQSREPRFRPSHVPILVRGPFGLRYLQLDNDGDSKPIAAEVAEAALFGLGALAA